MKKLEQMGSDKLGRRAAIASPQPVPVAVVRNDRQDGTHELLVAVAKIRFGVVGARCGGNIAFRAIGAAGKRVAFAGPAAFRAFHTLADALQEFWKRSFKRDNGIERTTIFREPFIEKFRLADAARKSIEHPAAGLARKPTGDKWTHQVVRQIAAAGEDGSGELSQRRFRLHFRAQQGPGAEVTEAEMRSQPRSLRPFAGRGRS